ncbi:MAG: MMPL family transporter [Myxococcota bacterium]
MSPWFTIATWVQTHRALSWLVAAGLFLACLAGLPRLQTDLGLETLLPSDPEVRAALQESDLRWGRDDQVFAAVVTAPDGQDLLTRTHLDQLVAVREALVATPEVLGATDLTTLPTLQHVPGLMGPHPGQVQALDFLATVPPEGSPRTAAWRDRTLHDGLRVPSLLSADGRRAVVLLTLASGFEQPKDLEAALDRVRAAVPDTPLDVQLAGAPVLRTELRIALAEDQARLAPRVGGLLALVLLLTMGRLRSVGFPVVLALASIACTLGVLGWLGRPVGFLSLAWMMLIPVAAVADAVHLSRALGEQPDLPEAMRAVGSACFVTTLTSAIGIGSLVVSGMPAVRQFAVDGAIGLGVTFALFLLLGPLLASPGGGGRAEALLERLSEGCARFAVRARVPVLVVAALLAVAGIAAGSTVAADYRLVENLAVERQVVQTTLAVDRDLGGSMQFSFALDGNLDRPEVVRALRDVRAAHRLDGETWQSPFDVTEAVLRTLAADRWADKDDWVQATLKRAPHDPTVRAPDGHTRVVVRTSDRGAAWLVARADTIADALSAALNPLGITVRSGGTALHAYRGLLDLPHELLGGLALATVVIGALIGMLLRSVKLALVSLLPNLLPLALTWGLLAALDWPLQLGTAVVFTLGLGLAVDDTIHVMARWRAHPGPDAIPRAAHDTGTAVVITSLALGVGVFALTSSQFRGMAEFGVLGCALVATALLSDLLVLPALLSFLAEPE